MRLSEIKKPVRVVVTTTTMTTTTDPSSSTQSGCQQSAQQNHLFQEWCPHKWSQGQNVYTSTSLTSSGRIPVTPRTNLGFRWWCVSTVTFHPLVLCLIAAAIIARRVFITMFSHYGSSCSIKKTMAYPRRHALHLDPDPVMGLVSLVTHCPQD